MGFEDTGGELEVYDLNLAAGGGGGPRLVASAKTAVRFSSVGWGRYLGGPHGSQRYPLGLIAGGMTDGTIHVWDAAALIGAKGDQQQQHEPLWTLQGHEISGSAVSAMAFHPEEPHQLAVGGGNGHVLVLDLSCPPDGKQQPGIVNPGGQQPAQSAEVTSVAWNSQVSHILASSSRDGTVGVWDMKQRKAWCRLQVEHGPVADVSWNPTEGLYLLTSSGDDRNPVIKVWDLGASTSMPLSTMAGHAAGVLKLSWCPHDDALILTCGKDNRTLLWDFQRLQSVAELPPDTGDDAVTAAMNSSQQSSSAANPSQLFASSSLSGQKHMRVFCAWSPLKRGLALTCSLDRKVQIHSILSLATRSGRPPKWMRPASAVTTGFGGTIVSVNADNKFATIRTVREQPVLAGTSEAFERELESTNTIVLCENRRAACKVGSPEEKMWGFMRVIFESNPREQLLEHLGFDANQIAHKASRYQETAAQQQDASVDNGVASMSLKDKLSPMSKSAEEVVKRALIVGNFEAAVECCFHTGNLSDALLLAYCGGGDLWTKTQERYFENESPKRPYLKLLKGIVGSKLEDMVAESDPKRWQETLAILSSYAQSEQFPTLCIALGDRLESCGDAEHASLCYMCALNVEHAAKFWITEFESANKKKGSLDIYALHNLVVKVSVFMTAAGDKAELPPNIGELFFQYAKALAEQGLFVTAAKYCKGSSMDSMVLRDRLYRSRESQGCLAQLGSPPEFPFTSVAVSKSRGSVSGSTRSSQQQTQSRSAYASQQQQAASTSQHSQQQTQMSMASDQLPPGWYELQDPASGRTYYANQTTGETSWDRPAAPRPAAQPSAHQSTSRDGDNASVTSNASSKRSTKAHLVSKYGDGFVTSASHPELADRYGNIGTSNPYTGVARPGTAAASAAQQALSQTEQAPTSGPVDIHSVELSDQHDSIKGNLFALYEYLVSVASHSEKRQLEEAKKGIEALVKKLSRNEVDEGTEANVLSIVTAISNHDFRSASSVVTELVNHEWKTHKDWLKGIKLLLQLAAKKIG